MVAPEWQGAGLGTALQNRLQEYAVSRGVRGFVAEILPRNARMLRLASGAPGVGDDLARRGCGARDRAVRQDRAAETVEAPGREGGRAVPVQAPI